MALVSSVILSGLEQMRDQFRLQMSGALTAVLVALPLVYFKGLPAAGYALIAVNSVRAAYALILVYRRSAGRGGENQPFSATMS